MIDQTLDIKASHLPLLDIPSGTRIKLYPSLSYLKGPFYNGAIHYSARGSICGLQRWVLQVDWSEFGS